MGNILDPTDNTPGLTDNTPGLTGNSLVPTPSIPVLTNTRLKSSSSQKVKWRLCPSMSHRVILLPRAMNHLVDRRQERHMLRLVALRRGRRRREALSTRKSPIISLSPSLNMLP